MTNTMTIIADWLEDDLIVIMSIAFCYDDGHDDEEEDFKNNDFPGGPPGGRADGRAGEVEGDHRGAGADLRRDVRILDPPLNVPKMGSPLKAPGTFQIDILDLYQTLGRKFILNRVCHQIARRLTFY